MPPSGKWPCYRPANDQDTAAYMLAEIIDRANYYWDEPEPIHQACRVLRLEDDPQTNGDRWMHVSAALDAARNDDWWGIISQLEQIM